MPGTRKGANTLSVNISCPSLYVFFTVVLFLVKDQISFLVFCVLNSDRGNTVYLPLRLFNLKGHSHLRDNSHLNCSPFSS